MSGCDGWAGRFGSGKGAQEETLWYYGELAREFERRGPEHLAAELRRTVEVMKALANT